MGIISTYDCGTLTTSGDLRDLRTYGYLDLDREWWDQNINRDITVNDRLYFTTGDISLVTTIAMYNMVFNKTMFREKGWDMPYQDVENGTCTFDKMKSYITAVSTDLNADDKMDSNDLYGMVYINSTVVAALNMSGERFAQIGEDGKVELRSTLDLDRISRLLLLLSGEAESLTASETTVSAQASVDMSKATQILDVNDPKVKELYEQLYLGYNKANDEVDDDTK